MYIQLYVYQIKTVLESGEILQCGISHYGKSYCKNKNVGKKKKTKNS